MLSSHEERPSPRVSISRALPSLRSPLLPRVRRTSSFSSVYWGFPELLHALSSIPIPFLIVLSVVVVLYFFIGGGYARTGVIM